MKYNISECCLWVKNNTLTLIEKLSWVQVYPYAPLPQPNATTDYNFTISKYSIIYNIR